jgi:hypothetical protein
MDLNRQMNLREPVRTPCRNEIFTRLTLDYGANGGSINKHGCVCIVVEVVVLCICSLLSGVMMK